MNRTAWLLIPVATVLLAACGSGGGVSPGYSASPAPLPPAGAAPWPLPSDPMLHARQAGLTPGTHEFFTYHVHAHLDIFVNGRHARVPGGIGIDIADPGVHREKPAGLRAMGTSGTVPGRASHRCIPTT